MGGLDHADIVRPISNRKRHDPEPVLHEPHDERLLQRGDPAADDALALHGEPEEELAVRVVRERVEERRAVDDEDVPAGAAAVVVPDDGGLPRVDALQGVRARGVVLRLQVLGDAFFLEDAALGEELVDGGGHLGVHGPAAVAGTPDDDDIVFASNKVRAMADSYTGA